MGSNHNLGVNERAEQDAQQEAEQDVEQEPQATQEPGKCRYVLILVKICPKLS